jgi:hypothetical protein
MPRKAVKEVIEHRITLGGLERELAKDLVLSMQVRNVATPAVSLMKDVSGMLVLGALLNEILGWNIDLAGITDMDELVQAFKSAIDVAQRQAEEFSETPDNPILARLGFAGRILEGIGDLQRLVLTGHPDGPQEGFLKND